MRKYSRSGSADCVLMLALNKYPLEERGTEFGLGWAHLDVSVYCTEVKRDRRPEVAGQTPMVSNIGAGVRKWTVNAALSYV